MGVCTRGDGGAGDRFAVCVNDGAGHARADTTWARPENGEAQCEGTGEQELSRNFLSMEVVVRSINGPKAVLASLQN